MIFFRSLSDIDQDGKLTAEEFILAMHLIDMAMSGLPLPPVLPADYIPPTFRYLSHRCRFGELKMNSQSDEHVCVCVRACAHARVCVCQRRVRSDSVQSDQKSVPEETEEENEINLEKKLPGGVCSISIPYQLDFWYGSRNLASATIPAEICHNNSLKYP